MRASLLIFAIALSGCSSNGARIEENALAAGLTRHETSSLGFRTLIYMKAPREAGEPLYVFLEGDGVPWRGGVIPNDDPTTGNPIALELLKRTARGGAYLTRPCYHRMDAPRCSHDRWTGARYSEEVVGVMTAAVRDALRIANARHATLVGYSGGGVLAVLIAERLDAVNAVITLGANLDVDAWTRHHGYLPLSESLDPAKSVAPHRWREVHFQGARDEAVPPATTSAYFERYPSARRELLAEHDHTCCWLDAWPKLMKAAEEINAESTKKGVQITRE